MRLLRTLVMGVVFVAATVAAKTPASPKVASHDPPSPQVRQPSSGKPVRVPSDVMQGLLLTKVDPIFPSTEGRVRATVTLHAIISKGGHVKKLVVISGPILLQKTAIDAVRQWTYKPYLVNGEPTEVDTTVVINYSINF
jgi:periplasmic protein TonB